jgi:hypothetical protein
MTRNAASSSSQELRAQGIEIVQADLDDPSSLRGIFADADAIFAVTDFWQPYFDAYPGLQKLSDRATGEHAYAIEVARGRAIVDAVAEQLAKNGERLKIFIWSTLPPVKELSSGKYTYVYHFDAKAAVAKYIATEHPDLEKKTSYLNMSFYATNMVKMSRVFSLVKVNTSASPLFTLSLLTSTRRKMGPTRSIAQDQKTHYTRSLILTTQEFLLRCSSMQRLGRNYSPLESSLTISHSWLCGLSI